MPPRELWEAYSNRTVCPSVSPSRFRVRSISPIFFGIGIPNLVCGYILGWRSVAYHFRVTVTLTLTGFYTKLNVWGSLGLNFEYDGGPIIEIGGPIFLYKLGILEGSTSFREGSMLSPGQ